MLRVVDDDIENRYKIVPDRQVVVSVFVSLNMQRSSQDSKKSLGYLKICFLPVLTESRYALKWYGGMLFQERN